jgi:hypothetical protein
MANLTWGIFRLCLGTNTVPRDAQHYRKWIHGALPGGDMVRHFDLAAVSWAIWKSRNKAIFDKKWIKHPVKILVYASTFMSYWAGLYNATIQEQITGGVETMLTIAYRLLARQRPPIVQMRPTIQDEAADETDDENSA